jgi:hypothetical protein
MPGGSQLTAGVGLAGLAALLFGLTAPIVQPASATTDTLAAGSVLYLGGHACRSAARRPSSRWGRWATG